MAETLRMPSERNRVHRYRRAGGKRQEWRCPRCDHRFVAETEGDALMIMRQEFADPCKGGRQVCCAFVSRLEPTGRFLPPADFR